jgi:hypothetical protein
MPKLFTTAELRRPGSSSFDIIVSYSGRGMKMFAISSKGHFERYTPSRAQDFVETLKANGYHDLRDPGYGS